MKPTRLAVVAGILLIATVGVALLPHKSDRPPAAYQSSKLTPTGPSSFGGIFVDSHDNIWVANRPRSLQDNDT